MHAAAKTALDEAATATGCSDPIKLHIAAKAIGRMRVFEQEAGILEYRAQVLEKSEEAQ